MQVRRAANVSACGTSQNSGQAGYLMMMLHPLASTLFRVSSLRPPRGGYWVGGRGAVGWVDTEEVMVMVAAAAALCDERAC